MVLNMKEKNEVELVVGSAEKLDVGKGIVRIGPNTMRTMYLNYGEIVKIKGEKVEGVQEGLLEEKQYTDIWENDEYLQFMYERLLLLKELLSENNSLTTNATYCNHPVTIFPNSVF